MSGPFLIGLVKPKKLLLFSDGFDCLWLGSDRMVVRSMRSVLSVYWLVLDASDPSSSKCTRLLTNFVLSVSSVSVLGVLSVLWSVPFSVFLSVLGSLESICFGGSV